MDTITKVNHLSFGQDLNTESTFMIKLASDKLDSITGSDLLGKIQSWISANMMMNNKNVPALIVDMENVEFIDSQGLQKLLACLKLMQSQNSSLLLCSQQPSVRLVFEISRMDQMFAVLPSADFFMNQASLDYQNSNYLVAA